MSKNKTQKPQPQIDMLYRIAAVERGDGGFDDETRSFRAILATDAAVPTFDFTRMDVVDEVIDLAGMDLPQRVPMLDSHDRSSVRGVLGSMSEFKVEGGQLTTRVQFNSTQAGQDAYQNYKEGHLDSFSVGARKLEREYNGNTLTIRKSRLIEGSAVVAGADPNAKALATPMMRSYIEPHSEKERVMLEELKQTLVERGMPEDTDGAALIEWVQKNLTKEEKQESGIADVLRKLGDTIEKPKSKLSDADIKRAVEAAGKRSMDIIDLCRENNVDAKQEKEWLQSDISVEEVARDILKRKASGGLPIGNAGEIEFGASQREKFYQAACDGVLVRAVQGAGLKPEKVLENAKASGDFDSIQRATELQERFSKPAAGWNEFRHVGITDLARQFCDIAGEKTNGLPRHEIVKRAMRLSNFVEMNGWLQRDSTAYHTTGSFANLMLDAANKTLLAAYDEAAVTYPIWVRTAPSASDFKQLHRIRFGELPDPEVIPENGPYDDKTTSDAKESYGVEKYGSMFSITMEAMVNDDLNAISRIPAMQGAAMRRKINRVCYAVLTANDALSDGKALFHADHNNLGSSALAIAQLNAAYTAMMTQSGLNSTTILNIMPRFLIVPAALSATALQLTRSIADPAVGGDTTGNSGVQNLYGPNGPRPLRVVVEGQLDASSSTAYYFAADSAQVDTVELTFLQGEESPVLERHEEFNVDAIKYKIRQTFAAKAIDYRGLRQGNS